MAEVGRRLTLLLVTTFFATVLAGCRGQPESIPDPRAYRGSDPQIRLDQALSECDLRLPRPATGIRFFVRHDWDGLVVWLTFGTSASGYLHFLADLGVRNDYLSSSDGNEFGAEEKHLGWAYEHGRKYLSALMTRATEAGQGYLITADETNEENPLIYLRCITQ